ncbi:MAG: type II toxin-antitoxin system RelE/ParE family toxin [candidate division NC10 bacterium]|nr:type II toxin-antitoxin system RelE/ParE family toxin [candidate division NC10 bacterium]MBI2456955.1 type II toxin-antitoxin system RelE/ParE family toxin [candidate division NC10 bacterium]
MPIPYRVVLTPTARSMLAAIKDRRIQEKIREKIDGLARDPDLQGKPLLGELTGLRGVRAVAQRYRIIYRVHQDRVEVLVVAIGLRREGHREDIYRLAQRLLRLKLLE